MEMKRALIWYLGIVVVMAGGLFLVLELFVNNSENAGSGIPESAAVSSEAEGQGSADTAAGRSGAAALEADDGAVISPDSRAESPSGSFGSRPVSAGAQGRAAASPLPETSKPSVPSTSPAADSGSYTVQVAALASRDKAAGVVDKLRNDGFSTGRIGRDLGDSLNRVWVGSFATRVEAVAMAGKLKGKGYNTYVRAVQ